MQFFLNQNGTAVVEAIIETIQANAKYLSEIDGAIGDGDHGINMNKGVTLCKKELASRETGLADALKILSRILMMEIGGAMGPLYGTFFKAMSKACQDKERIDAGVFHEMLRAALAGVQDIGGAQVGDKTMLDTLVPAVEAYEAALQDGQDFSAALKSMQAAAAEGKESTKSLVAKVGRASRLGERSKGNLDPGATSCYLILNSAADAIVALIE
ncbi:MAG: dihydroxyacetone kinase subunit L [Desulfobacterales bacterium]|nr:MAG: dihydroxyacetone kinase subunit L [Desulfobacterales bacterium]